MLLYRITYTVYSKFKRLKMKKKKKNYSRNSLNIIGHDFFIYYKIIDHPKNIE